MLAGILHPKLGSGLYDNHEECTAWARLRMAEHHELYAMSGSEVGLGSLLAAVLSVCVNFSQFALQKSYCLTACVGTDCTGTDNSMSDSLCCDFRKGSGT